MRGPMITAEEIDRMYALRAQGMSNAEIADAMDRSRQAVLSKIGRQPDMNRCTYGSQAAKVTDLKPDNLPTILGVTRPVKVLLKLVSTVSTLEGQLFTYKVEPGNKIRLLTATGTNLDFTPEDFKIFASEIQEVLQFAESQSQ